MKIKNVLFSHYFYKFFILWVIYSLLLITHTYAMSDDADPVNNFTSHLSAKKEIKDPRKNEQDEETGVLSFLSLPLEIHMDINSYLDFSDLLRSSLVCKGSLEIVTRLVFESFYSSLSQEVQLKLFPSQDEKTISRDKAYESLQTLNYSHILQEIYEESLCLEFPDKVNYYGPIRLALLKNPNFQKVEDKAQQSAKKDFCLDDQSQEQGSWLKTCIYYSLFWQEQKNEQVRNWLLKKKFYFAQICQSLWDRDGRKHGDSKLSDIRFMIQQCQKEVISYDSELESIKFLTEYMISLYQTDSSVFEGHFSEGTDSSEKFAGALRAFAQTKKSEQSLQNYNWIQLVSYLFEGLPEEKAKKDIFATIASISREKVIPVAYLEARLRQTIQNGVERFYGAKLRKLYTELLGLGNRLFILLWQKKITAFLTGLSMTEQRDIYYQAQKSYQEEFGNVYSGQFQHTHSLSQFLKQVFSQQTSTEWNTKVSRFYSLSYNYAQEAEESWGPLVDMGDPLVASELAKAWINSEDHDPQQYNSQEKANYWFSRYQALAPSLPFGDFSSLSYSETKH